MLNLGCCWLVSCSGLVVWLFVWLADFGVCLKLGLVFICCDFAWLFYFECGVVLLIWLWFVLLFGGDLTVGGGGVSVWFVCVYFGWF